MPHEIILIRLKIDVINLPVHTFSMDKTKYANVIWKKKCDFLHEDQGMLFSWTKLGSRTRSWGLDFLDSGNYYPCNKNE